MSLLAFNIDAGDLPLDNPTPNNDAPASGAATESPQTAPAENQATLPGVESPAPEDGADPDAPWGRKADGTPRAKPGRKGGGESVEARVASVTPAPPRKPKAPPIPAPAPIAPAAPPKLVDYERVGQAAANLWFNLGVVVFGQDWEPDTAQGEHIAVKDGFRDYFKSIEAPDIPPGWVLAAVLLGYTVKRVNKPTVKGRIQSLVTWARSKVGR